MAAYIQFTSRLKSTTQDGILAEAQQIAVSSSDNTSIKSYIDSKVASAAGAAYRPKGSVTFATLSALTSASVGDVYNITDAFTLNGKKYAAGSNVACLKAFSAKVTPDETYWDVLGGFIDLSPYALAADLAKAKTDLEGSISNTNAKLSRLASSLDERVPNEIRLLNGGAYYQISGQDEAHPAKIGKDSAIGTGVAVNFDDIVVSENTYEHSLLFKRIDKASGVSDDFLKFVRYGSGIQIASGDEGIHIDNDVNVVFNTGGLIIKNHSGGEYAELGSAAKIYNGAVLGTKTVIGNNATIGTNARLSEYSYFSGRCNNVLIGYPYGEAGSSLFCHIGSGVTIRDNVHIDEGVTIDGHDGTKTLEFDGNPVIAFNNTNALIVDDDKISFGTGNTYYTFGRFVNGSEVTPLFSGKVENGNIAGDDTVYIGKSLISVGSNKASENGVWIGKNVSIGDGAMVAEKTSVNSLSALGYGEGKDATTPFGTSAKRGLLITSGMVLASEKNGELWFGTDPTTAEGRKKVAFADDVASAKSDVTELAKRVSALEALMTVAS